MSKNKIKDTKATSDFCEAQCEIGSIERDG